jgi:hypothetical protein
MGLQECNTMVTAWPRSFLHFFTICSPPLISGLSYGYFALPMRANVNVIPFVRCAPPRSVKISETRVLKD